jgi:ABC-type sugar transport system ATPase subunit
VWTSVGVLTALTAIASALVGINGPSAQATASSAPQATPVSVASVSESDVTAWDEFSGRLEAVERVDVRSRVAGAVQAVHFREGALVKKGEDVYFVYEGNELKLPQDKAEAEALQEYIGREVIAGLRPECIHDDELSISKCDGATVECDVDVTELMGAEIYLYLTVGEEGRLTARVSSRSTTRAGEKITVGFDMDRMHFFDKDTERCFLH